MFLSYIVVEVANDDNQKIGSDDTQWSHAGTR